MLELRELRNFVEVAERLNITIAASVVNLSQPALSRQIQALERKLGVALFERIGKRLVLTADGADLATRAIELLERADALKLQATHKGAEQSGTLRVGATPQTIAWLLSPAMARFQSLYPKVTLMVCEGNNDALIEMVEHGAAHLVVANLGISNILVGQPLFQAQLFALLPPMHPCLGMSSIPIEKIAEDAMIVMRRGFLTRHLYEQVVAAHGLRPRILLESDSTQALAALARDGHGVGIVSSSAQNLSALQNAVPIHSDICQTTAEVSALWNPKRYRPAYFQSALDTLVGICAEHGLSA
ncbi:LysR family transcriptional regulator [Antarcticimicrobium sediminis]|uniref:LysR family transcriptional regulator n=1 Tax=Antarcticimicrobium sediminis TaxID=2546227 RepID=A0A4R5EZT3_9RHOB|nr:LysR family transcriptional regulator [Antarcticimicrobium sediminis]TDE40678.1 LysR family transcriptional regulator [Antarcticimicrobium sediminis]